MNVKTRHNTMLQWKITVIKSIDKIRFTDNDVVHMIRRTGFLVRLGRRGYLLAVLKRDVMVGSRWLGNFGINFTTELFMFFCAIF